LGSSPSRADEDLFNRSAGTSAAGARRVDDQVAAADRENTAGVRGLRPKPGLPVNGWRLLPLVVMVATIAPNGVVLEVDGFSVLNDKLRMGARPAEEKRTST
jgi:hypothetical protein